MKINSVYLASFGKFKDYRLDFSDGFNTIYGENEKGKTTIMNFIRMMFYGTSGKSTDTAKNLRKRYMPFDSDLMAGSISFTHEGVSYTLERIFKASNAGDKLKLINHSTGNIETFNGKTDIGATFFGLSDAAFEQSAFIGNLSVFSQNEDASGELNSKLSNITTSMDEDVSLELIKSRLLKAKELLMSRSGKIGLYDKAKQDLLKTEEMLLHAEEKEARVLVIKEEIAKKQEELNRVSKESARLFELLKNSKILGLKANLERCLKSFKTIDELSEKIRLKNGQIADKAFLEQLKTAFFELEQAKHNLIKKQAELEKATIALEKLKADSDLSPETLKGKKALLEQELKVLEDEIDSLSIKVSLSQGKKPFGATVLSIIGGALVLTGAGLGFINPLLFAVCPLGLILLILGILFAKKSGASEKYSLIAALETKKASKQGLLSKIEALDQALNNILIENATRKALLDSKTADYLDLKEAALQAKETEISAEAQLNSIYSLLNSSETFDGIDGVIKTVEESLALINAEKGKLAFVYEQTGCSSKEEAEARLSKINSDSALSGMSIEESDNAQRKLKEISEEKNRLSSETATLKQELKNLLSSGETLSRLRLKIDEKKKNLQAQKDFCDVSDFALSTLDEAFSDLRHSYSHVLEEKTARFFEGLTGGAYTSVNISKDFQIGVTAKDSFGTKEWQYLSLGTAGQAYFALRLALANLIGQESSPLPILLDDSFSEYDDTRALVAIKFLKEQSENSQIILFTCHSGIADMAKNLDSDIKYL